MATSKTRNYDDEALWQAMAAEKLLASGGQDLQRAQVHATLAVAYSNIGSQS